MLLMADAEGAPTYLLMRGGHYLKDSRLLPLGWRPDHAEAKAQLAELGQGTSEGGGLFRGLFRS